jgi:hypothetical protein
VSEEKKPNMGSYIASSKIMFTSNAFRQWYHGTFWISFKLNPEYRLSFRVERMYDPLQVVAVTNTRNGFMTNGYTTSFDVASF